VETIRTARTLEAEWRQVLRGSVITGVKEDDSSTGRVWSSGFHHVTARSHLAGILELTNRFFLIFLFFSGRGEPQITETANIESVGTGPRLYFVFSNCVSFH
jgi:hypothetical protein